MQFNRPREFSFSPLPSVSVLRSVRLNENLKVRVRERVYVQLPFFSAFTRSFADAILLMFSLITHFTRYSRICLYFFFRHSFASLFVAMGKLKGRAREQHHRYLLKCKY